MAKRKSLKKKPYPSLFHLLLLDRDEQFNKYYKPACRALADWFVANPKEYLISNSGHAFRLDSINTEGIWLLKEIHGKFHPVPDDFIRWCFVGHPLPEWEKTNLTKILISPTDTSGIMNFVTPLCRKWAGLSYGEFGWLPSYLAAERYL